MMFKALEHPAEWNWLKERAHTILCGDMCGIVALNDQGAIQAIAAFDSFTTNACNVHFAIDNPRAIKYGFLHEIARYLFMDRNRTRIFGLVPSCNTKALRLDKHIGMREVTRIPNALAEGIDYVVLEMKKEDCKWLPIEMRRAA